MSKITAVSDTNYYFGYTRADGKAIYYFVFDIVDDFNCTSVGRGARGAGYVIDIYVIFIDKLLRDLYEKHSSRI